MNALAAPLPLIVIEHEDDAREELRLRLDRHPRVELLKACASTEVAIAAVERGLLPRVALVGVRPRMSGGARHLRALRARLPTLEIVALTWSADADDLLDTFRCGAVGCLLKDSPADELARAAFEAVSGGAPMSPHVARALVTSLRRPAGAGTVSERECEVLSHLVRGSTYPEIGRLLSISTGTVQSHIKAIYRKLHVSTKAEAAAEALRRGIL